MSDEQINFQFVELEDKRSAVLFAETEQGLAAYYHLDALVHHLAVALLDHRIRAEQDGDEDALRAIGYAATMLEAVLSDSERLALEAAFEK